VLNRTLTSSGNILLYLAALCGVALLRRPSWFALNRRKATHYAELINFIVAKATRRWKLKLLMSVCKSNTPRAAYKIYVSYKAGQINTLRRTLLLTEAA